MQHEARKTLNEGRIQSRGRPESRKELDSFLVKRPKTRRFEGVMSRKLILQFPLILIHLFTYLFTLKNRSVLTIHQSCPCGLSLGIHDRGALETRLNDLSQKRISISSFVYLPLTNTPNEQNHYVNTLHLSCLYPQKTSTTLRSMAMVLLTAWEFLTTTDP